MIHLNRAAIKNRVEFLDTSLYNPKIVDLIQYINQHLTESLDVDFLSSRVYLSKYYMMRLFKAETGYTIGNYITYRRLLLARTLILDGMPITQACLASGFQDYSTFFTSLQNRISRTTQNAFTITLTEMSQTEFPSVFLFRYHSPHLPLHCEAALHASRWRVPVLCRPAL